MHKIIKFTATALTMLLLLNYSTLGIPRGKGLPRRMENS